MNPADAANALNTSEMGLRQTLNKLHKQGLVECVRWGIWGAVEQPAEPPQKPLPIRGRRAREQQQP
jgi:predicted ArsR family transcriptional regulator